MTVYYPIFIGANVQKYFHGISISDRLLLKRLICFVKLMSKSIYSVLLLLYLIWLDYIAADLFLNFSTPQIDSFRTSMPDESIGSQSDK